MENLFYLSFVLPLALILLVIISGIEAVGMLATIMMMVGALFGGVLSGIAGFFCIVWLLDAYFTCDRLGGSFEGACGVGAGYLGLYLAVVLGLFATALYGWLMVRASRPSTKQQGGSPDAV
ncbi:hypothetical protein [Herbaspirillum robiniae]|uniref:hypothetical protein n=1 Tax=Herbaspirillum robiniae TaxID=2014887 RepID=UPI003D7868D3